MAPHRESKINLLGPQRTPHYSSRSASPRVAASQPIGHRQQRLGNRGVLRLLGLGRLQAKLTVSQPSDPYEQEADRVAEKVMRMPDLGIRGGVTSTETSPPKAQAERIVQRRTGPASDGLGSFVPDDFPTDFGPGRPLDRAVRAFFEPRFRADFGEVRVHTDARAAESAQAVNALAYTVGRDIVFRAGRYAPETVEGKKLLAHELTHVMQQGHDAGSVSPVAHPLVQRACQFFPEYASPDTYCETEAEARANITRACPPYRDDFLYRDGPPTHRWRPIPGFGCAHHVAHILGIRNGPVYARCRGGFSVTIEQVTEGRAAHPLAEAQVNDIWSSGIHSGVVTQVDATGPRVRVDQCGVRGNAQQIWVTYGDLYR